MKASDLIRKIQFQCRTKLKNFQVITDTLNTNLEIKIVTDQNTNTEYLMIKNKDRLPDIIVEKDTTKDA